MENRDKIRTLSSLCCLLFLLQEKIKLNLCIKYLLMFYKIWHQRNNGEGIGYL